MSPVTSSASACSLTDRQNPATPIRRHDPGERRSPRPVSWTPSNVCRSNAWLMPSLIRVFLRVLLLLSRGCGRCLYYGENGFPDAFPQFGPSSHYLGQLSINFHRRWTSGRTSDKRHVRRIVVTPYAASTPGGIRTPNPRFRSYRIKYLNPCGLTSSSFQIFQDFHRFPGVKYGFGTENGDANLRASVPARA